MKRVMLQIELLEDCVFSSRSASEGAHRSLDRVPGAALLGMAAGRLYRQLGARAFEAFHSGRVRFGDGLPLGPDGTTGWPVPMAWHYEKVAGYKNQPKQDGPDAWVDPQRVLNFQHCSQWPQTAAKAPPQPKQLREGYVTATGRLLEPARDVRIKTAIEFESGRAAEAQLFGYEALQAGQRFLSCIEADDAVEQGLFDQLVDALCGERLLGRSRSAEYGRVRIERAGDPKPMPGEPRPQRLTLWLLSDLALVDALGQATVQPEPAHFGLEEGRVLWDQTFLRVRRYSPWNAARGGPDEERLVLQAGGVVSLEVPADLDRERLAERLQRGIGRHREAGLGRVWLDPPLLAGEHPVFDTVPPEPAGGKGSRIPVPDHPLAAWLRARNTDWKSEAEQAAAAFVEAYRKLLEAARLLAGVPGHEPFGPSRSQWGNVQHKATDRRGEALHSALFEGESRVVKRTGEGWNIEVRVGEEYRSLAEWLRDRMAPDGLRVADDDRDRAYAHFVRVAARQIQDGIQGRRA